MRAGVKTGLARKGKETYRVVDLDHPEKAPILNRSGDPVDGGGHRVKGISEMLASEVNDALEKHNGKPLPPIEEE